MFNSARLKLTAWYLLVIMLISVAFSTVIFRVETLEIERLARSPRFRLPEEVIEDVTRRRLVNLLEINVVILISAGTLGYILAGRTLKPIKEMVDEQNRFIGDASHELRTPLASLRIVLEVNLRGKKILRDCLDQIDKLQSLTDGLLQLSSDYMKFENVSFSEVVREAVHEISPKAKQKEISIENKVTDYEISGEKYSLIDLVVILLDNAIKYSPAKSVITVDAKNSDGSMILSVADQGIGIEKKDLPHIFSRFYRADSARHKSDGGGYGLGLSIAKKIVSSHHGSISVTSHPGSGTTVHVYLPKGGENI